MSELLAHTGSATMYSPLKINQAGGGDKGGSLSRLSCHVGSRTASCAASVGWPPVMMMHLLGGGQPGFSFEEEDACLYSEQMSFCELDTSPADVGNSCQFKSSKYPAPLGWKWRRAAPLAPKQMLLGPNRRIK